MVCNIQLKSFLMLKKKEKEICLQNKVFINRSQLKLASGKKGFFF